MSKFVAKKHLVRSPTLLIGIGGIGGQIVAKVSNALSDHDKSCIRMLVMDTDTSALDKFENSDIPYIQTSKNQTVQAYLEANKDYLSWFPSDPFINAKSMIDGAGQIRSVSRLGALASKANGNFEKLRRAVDSILENQGDSLVRSVRIMIVGSATGGTGSGLGIQLPFYVRKVLEEANIPNVLIRGLFLMPNLVEAVQDTEPKKKAVNVNGYAFLKELNAFYHAQTVSENDTLLRVEEYVPGLRGDDPATAMSAMIPYDFLYLVEKNSNAGNLGDLEEYIERSSQVVVNQLFSPVSSKGFSSEDNLITSTVPARGMNRYCGAGISNAIYPKDEITQYCTVRFATQILNELWLKIDETFKIRDEQQRRLRVTNPNLNPLNKAEAYCQIFDEMCDPMKHDVVSEVSTLKGELLLSVTDSEGKTSKISLVDSLMNNITMHLDDVFSGSGLTSGAEDCKMTAKVTNTPEDVSSDIVRKMDMLRQYKEFSEKTVSSLVVSVAEEILPTNFKLARDYSRDAQYNIYVALDKKHPIIVRYVLYSILTLLKAEKEKADSRLNSQINRVSIFNKDYFDEGDKDTRKESPTEALDKVKKGLLTWMNVYSASYKTKVQEIIDDIAGEATFLLDIAQFTLKSTAYRTVIERLEILIELYENFFDELENILEDKKKEVERLEAGKGKGVNNTFVGDRYICNSEKCKRFLYNEFITSIPESELEMSESMKKGFFDKMFVEYEAMLEKETNPNSFVKPTSYRDLFNQGILDPIVAQFSKKGFKHIDIGILDAIFKQFQIETQNPKAKKESDEFISYFRAICTSLCTLADPYLVYTQQVAGYPSGGRLSYAWGINHSAVADFQIGEPASDADELKLREMFDRAGDAILPDDSFSPYKLVCYATIYDLRIENCSTYKIGSTVESYYSERLNNYVNKEHFVRSTDRDSDLDVIHPHLDLHWHEHAYLPELMEYDDKKMCNDIRLAFLLASALNRCSYIVNTVDCIEGWAYREYDVKNGKDGTLQLISMDGQPIKSKSVLALYKAFDRNRVMVKNILDCAESYEAKAYNDSAFGGVTYNDIIAQNIISGMICTVPKSSDPDSADLSIIDILYGLYLNSGNRSITKLLINTLDEYLYGYCLKMMNNNENRAKDMHNKIKKAIYDASNCVANAATTSTFFIEDVANFNS